MRGIFQLEVDGRKALGFDTGLDSRSFAQARFSDFLAEPGFIVSPDGGVTEWKASGVIEDIPQREQETSAGTMIVWGPAFEGVRLDLLLEDESRSDAARQDAARFNAPLAALSRWIKARLLLEEKLNATHQDAPPSPAPLPCAALIAPSDGGGAVRDGAVSNGGKYPEGAVFFCPEQLSRRAAAGGLAASESYLHPDLSGAEAAAFSAAAMLYRLFAGTPPFPAAEAEARHQDMREGNFLPLRLAAPGLDEISAGLLQSVLSVADLPQGGGAAALARLAEIADAARLDAAQPASFLRPLSEAERRVLEQEKARFIKRKNITVNAKRFMRRNTAVMICCLAAVLAVGLVAFSIVRSRSRLPTTAGLNSAQVVEAYYGAFGELNHDLMEACVTGKAGKTDINFVVNLFVINRVRQAYEQKMSPLFISAAEWQETGFIPPGVQVFGVTDLRIERLSGAEDSGETRYRAVYTLWMPRQQDAEAAPPLEGIPPQDFKYRDDLRLVRKKDAWRITELTRSAE